MTHTKRPARTLTRARARALSLSLTRNTAFTVAAVLKIVTPVVRQQLAALFNIGSGYQKDIREAHICHAGILAIPLAFPVVDSHAVGAVVGVWHYHQLLALINTLCVCVSVCMCVRSSGTALSPAPRLKHVCMYEYMYTQNVNVHKWHFVFVCIHT
jgi:hypothetical protein